MKAPIEWLRRQFEEAERACSEAQRRLASLKTVLKIAEENTNVEPEETAAPAPEKKSPSKKEAAPTPPRVGTTEEVQKRANELFAKGLSPTEAWRRICEERKGLPVPSKATVYTWHTKYRFGQRRQAPPSPVTTATVSVNSPEGRACNRPDVPVISDKSCLDWQWRWRGGFVEPSKAIEHLKHCGPCQFYLKSLTELKEAAVRKHS